MTWTYVSTEPTALDKLRGKIGDSNEGAHLLEDEVLARLLSASGVSSSDTSSDPQILTPAIRAVGLILAKVDRDIDRSVNGINTVRSQKTTQIRELLEDLKAERALVGTPTIGGIRYSQKQAAEADTDLIPPSFDVRRDDIPGGTLRIAPSSTEKFG